MEESATYRAIIEKGRSSGRMEEARRLLMLMGKKRFGNPSTSVRKVLTAITDIERLEKLSIDLLDATTWEELLAS